MRRARRGAGQPPVQSATGPFKFGPGRGGPARGPGPHQSGVTHLCRRWGTDWPEARVGTGLGLAGPHGPAPGLRHPEPGPAGAGRSPGHCTSHELRFMLTRVAPLGRQTTVRALPCWKGRYKPLESLQTHPTRALFARSDPAVAHIFSVPRPAHRSVLQNYRGPSQHIHFVQISLFARPVFAVRVPLVCAASLYPRGSVRSTFGQCLLPCAISVCHLLSTRIGLVSFWSVKNLCEHGSMRSSIRRRSDLAGPGSPRHVTTTPCGLRETRREACCVAACGRSASLCRGPWTLLGRLRSSRRRSDLAGPGPPRHVIFTSRGARETRQGTRCVAASSLSARSAAAHGCSWAGSALPDDGWTWQGPGHLVT